eukprot:1502752-Rhodomonas_salina.3
MDPRLNQCAFELVQVCARRAAWEDSKTRTMGRGIFVSEVFGGTSGIPTPSSSGTKRCTTRFVVLRNALEPKVESLAA